MNDRELIADRAPGFDEVVRALAGAYDVQSPERRETDQVHLDTFDGLLRTAGLGLVHEDGRLCLYQRESGDRVEEALLAPAPRAPVPGRELPEGALREAVLAVIEDRALLPLAYVSLRAETIRVLDPLQKTVVRLELLTPSLAGERRRPTPLSARVRLHAIRGYEDDLRRAQKLLEGVLRLSPSSTPLDDEAIVASGATPGGTSSKIEVPMRADERSDMAVARVLRRLLEVMDANLPGAIADIDPEFLHDYRVSVRRTRSVQREMHRVFRTDELDQMRQEFKWLQLITGEARDLDVYVLGFESMRKLVPKSMRGDLEPLLVALGHRRAAAHRRMGWELRSDRARALRSNWEMVLHGMEHRFDGDRPDAGKPIGEVASRRIVKVYRRMLKMGGGIERAGGVESPPEDYHELRKKGKELRYLLELFGQPLHDADVVKPMIKRLKDLQDVLGHHQDREVQMGMLRELRDEVASLPDGPQALMAMGVLMGRLEEDAASTRAQFAERFAAFGAKEQRRLVEDTFS